jgi:hypothetical protein
LSRLIFLIPLFALAVTQTSFAASDNRNINDLMYRPKAHVFYLIDSLSYNTTTQSITSGLGPSALTVSTQTNTATANSLEIGYGLLERLTLSAIAKYYFSNPAKVDYGSGSTRNGQSETYQYSGLSDPLVKLGFRLLEQSNFFLMMDVFAGYSPGLSTSNKASLTSPGNMARGGGQFVVGADIGHKFSGFSFALGISQEFNAQRTYTDLTNNQQTQVTGGDATAYGLDLQFELGNSVDLLLGYHVTSYSQKKETNQTTSVVTTTGNLSFSEIAVGFNFELIKEKLLLQPSAFFGSSGGGQAMLTQGSTQLFSTVSSTTTFALGMLLQF